MDIVDMIDSELSDMQEGCPCCNVSLTNEIYSQINLRSDCMEENIRTL